MSRIFAWLACLLFSVAWWSVFFNLTAFTVLMVSSMTSLMVGELLWHIRYRRAYRRRPPQHLMVVGGGEQ